MLNITQSPDRINHFNYQKTSLTSSCGTNKNFDLSIRKNFKRRGTVHDEINFRENKEDDVKTIRRRRNLTVQQMVPNDLELTSDYEKQQLSKPGVVQYSKVSGILKNKRIQAFVQKK
jgi:hypothetical protein